MKSNELLEIAQRAAIGALQIVKDYRGVLTDTIETKSSTTDMVTVVDKACEERIRSIIHAARPQDGFIGEETGEQLRGDLTWIVDPIDGTTNFVYGFPAYAVSIAVKDGEHALCSVVLDLPHEILYSAKRGGGAQCNGRQLALRTTTDLSQALVATGFSYRAEERKTQARTLASILPRIRDIRRMGAASLDLVAVANGQIDAYYEVGLKPWDFEGGRLIVEEAGGVVGSLDSDTPTSTMTIAANRGLFQSLQELLREAIETEQHSG
jgi:myo-inositol-1(or 4)-monophosphatase